MEDEPSQDVAGITWAYAEWDGASIAIECRTALPSSLRGRIVGPACDVVVAEWRPDPLGDIQTASVPWRDAERPPRHVVIAANDADVMTISVFDARRRADLDARIPGDVDPATAEAIRDALLFEQYGGRCVAGMDDSMENAADIQNLQPDIGDEVLESYGVPALERAREDFAVVDSWEARRQSARTTFELELVREDACRLREAFEREAERRRLRDPRMAIGAKLANEELTLRCAETPNAAIMPPSPRT